MPDFRIINSDCIVAMREMADNSVDAIVTDPPYGLSDHRQQDVVECLKAWCEGKEYFTKKKGFMGKGWDSWVPGPEVWREALRVLKPGGHLLAFAGTRSMDLMCMAIRIAGFELRDSIGHAHDGGEAPLLAWCHGQGFPKSRNIGRDADLARGIEREVVDRRDVGHDITGGGFKDAKPERKIMDITKGNSEFEGWGSALKPAWEPIILCRKPLEGTIAQNAMKWGVGGINIDGCRISHSEEQKTTTRKPKDGSVFNTDSCGIDNTQNTSASAAPEGRFPANLVLSHSEGCRCVGTKKVKGITGGTGNHDGSVYGARTNQGEPVKDYSDANGMEEVESWECVEGCPIRLMDEQSGVSKGAIRNPTGKPIYPTEGTAMQWNPNNVLDKTVRGFDDKGGASRFFYTAKASKRDRDEGCEGLPIKQSVGGGGGIGDYLEDVNSASGKYGSEKAPARNNHPTVKSTALMRWLTRLVVPPNGICFDPFAGSGSTGKACMLEGFNFIGIEQDAEYCKIAEARIRFAQRGTADQPASVVVVNPAAAMLAAAKEKPAAPASLQLNLFETEAK